MLILSSIPGNFRLKMPDTSPSKQTLIVPLRHPYSHWDCLTSFPLTCTLLSGPLKASSLCPTLNKECPCGRRLCRGCMTRSSPVGGLFLPLLAGTGCSVSTFLELRDRMWQRWSVPSFCTTESRSPLGYPCCINSGNPAAWSPSVLAVCSFLILIWVKGRKSS